MKIRILLPILILLALGALVVVFRAPLLRWFTLHEAAPAPANAAAAETTGVTSAATALPEPTGVLSAPAVAVVQPVLAAVEILRQALLRDDLAAAHAAAARIEPHLDSDAIAALADPAVQANLVHARTAAASLHGAADLKTARIQAGEVYRALVHLASHSEDLRAGRHLFECPMAEGYQLWLQDPETIANPYMGQAMPMCGIRLEWADQAHQQAAPANRAPAQQASANPTLPEPVMQTLQAVLADHERVRAVLAGDLTTGLTALAQNQTQALRQAATDASSDRLRAVLTDAADHAAALAQSTATTPTDIEAVRLAYGEMTRALAPLIASDQRLQQGLQLFSCPMAQDYGYWFQTDAKMANPYMGTRMLQCGSSAAWSDIDASAVLAAGTATPAPVPAAAASGPDNGSDIAYWTCSMHPSVKQKDAGTCPICAMDLTPVTVEEQRDGLLFVDEHRRQLINFGTTTVTSAPLVVPISGLATVTPAESQRQAVNLRVAGWIEHLHANHPGQPIVAGEPLFTLYSPQLYQAQEEFLIAQRHREASTMAAARERLRLAGLSESQIVALSERGSAQSTVDILAPRSGLLLTTTVIAGDSIAAGTTVMEIVDLSTVWIDLEVFAGDLAHLRPGLPVTLTLSHQPDTTIATSVDYIYPTLDAQRRTARVRLVVPNPDLILRPGMHATGVVTITLGEGLLIPREAVVYTGRRRLVFLDIGRGRLRPREVTVGIATPTHFEVRSGLQAGDRIVSSGTFLIASESRVRSAETIWAAELDAPEVSDGTR